MIDLQPQDLRGGQQLIDAAAAGSARQRQQKQRIPAIQRQRGNVITGTLVLPNRSLPALLDSWPAEGDRDAT